MRLLFLTLSFLVSIHCFSQAPTLGWQATIGGDSDDFNRSALDLGNGEYLIGGISTSGISGDKTEANIGLTDFWVFKLSASGLIEWQNTIGGTSTDNLMTMEPTTDGGFILVGYSSSDISGDKTENSRGGDDYWIVKINSMGAVEWDKTIGGDSQDQANVIKQTTDGGYIVGGFSSSNASGEKSEDSLGQADYWVVKLDSLGNLEWEETIGGSQADRISDLCLALDGGYVLLGHSVSDSSVDKSEDSLGEADYWVVKIDVLGNIEWDNTIGGDIIDEPTDIIKTTDNHYVIAGSSNSNSSGDKIEPLIGVVDLWVLKLNINGEIVWQNSIGGTSPDYFQSNNSLKETLDGGYVLGAFSASNIGVDKTENNRGQADYWVIKTTSDGDILWDKTIGGDRLDSARAILQASNGNYLVVGSSDSTISGDKTENHKGGSDYWIVELVSTLGINENELTETIQVYPNPVNDALFIVSESLVIDKATILTVVGKLVKTFSSVKNGLNISDLKSGTYLLQIKSGQHSVMKKIIKN